MSEGVGHVAGGTEFADFEGAKEYARNRHGPDGSQLLDPYFLPALAELADESDTIDIGAGAAPWAIAAAKAGANSVFAFDLSYQMTAQAAEAVSELDTDRPQLAIASAMDIPTRDDAFGLALSINVGCNLPSHDESVYPVLRHFQEIHRVLRPGGYAIFTTPSSLNDVFTKYAAESDARDLAVAIDNVEDEEQMRKVLNGYPDVLRATVAETTDGWKIAEPDDKLTSGQPIWRRIPGMVVPNYYHTEEEYMRVMEAADLTIVDQHRPLLEPHQYEDAENVLGSQYTRTNAFGIYVLQKI